ncbi:MAG: transferrin receptor-like dimerization domain-containing protein, partial [bacterium]
IYSDPKGDGFNQGDVYPKGPYRPADGVQRGSVMDMPVYSGDPLTPGIAATENAKRLDMKDVETFTKIPVLPISYADAELLLASIGGRVAPESWRGNLPITYKIGPGPAKVHLKLAFNWNQVKINDVVARMQGSEYPDEWIIRGNHHDAWVNGAEDPTSGQVCLLEEARALGMLAKQGWKPKRTIIYCAWDGEEEGLLGSTEWVEAHADELQTKAVLYINTDSNGRGYLNIAGSHSLEKFINGVAKDINDPEKNISVWKRLQSNSINGASSIDERKTLRSGGDLEIDALGSGSDYTPFLEHAGVASLNLGYGGEDGGGIYHSIYDSFYWYTHFSDTSFVYGKALAQTVGTAVIRAADADILPFEFTRQSATFAKYLDEIKKLAKDKREEIIDRNAQIEEGTLSAISDPQETTIIPVVQEVPPFLNFSPLENAMSSLQTNAERYKKALEKFQAANKPLPKSVNKKLIESERKLTHADGLPKRPWFKHQIYAPGFYTGYGVKTIPGVREAIEQKNWKEAEEHIIKVARILEGEAALILSAAADLNSATR